MSHQEPEAKIFACSQSVYLAERFLKYGIPLGKLPCQNTATGFNIRGLMYLLFVLPPNSDNLMELLLMIDAAKRASQDILQL
jgi:ribose-phosphate pyrophosphokinase